jgi:hypothetical protein
MTMFAIAKNERGITLIEVLIASFLSALVAGAALHFYLTEHKVWLTQSDVADMQQNARACLDEISGTLRMAGYGLPSAHPAYSIRQDSLIVCFARDTFIDTILYCVGQPDYSSGPCLMRQIRNQRPEIFAENIESLTVNRLTATIMEVALVARSERPESQFEDADGYRRRTLTTRVHIRNIGI